MPISKQNNSALAEESQAIALAALAWTLEDDRRAERLLALTGLAPHDLRARLTDPELLDATLGFLEAHQNDFIACAAALGLTPERLIDARHDLNLRENNGETTADY